MVFVHEHRCPYCSSDDVERTHRQSGVFDRLVRVFGLRLYRCRECDQRFYDLPSRQKAS